MLTLRRRIGQSIVIGNDIEVHVVAVHAGQVEVTVSAPASVLVDRKEVRDGLVPRNRREKGSSTTHEKCAESERLELRNRHA